MLGGLAICGLCGCANQNNNNGGSEGNSQNQNVDEKALVSYHTPEAIKNRGELKVGVVKQRSGNDVAEGEDLDGGINYLYSKSDDGN